ncbi:hypothetical protein BDF19DRAFT_484103 [Syncephalis fuscata]|nr:hypothetical protein BDF19DRAFT_484103 [Syncephalis fuscata]
MIPLSEFPIPRSEETPQGIGITLDQFIINNPSLDARAPYLKAIFADAFKGVTYLHKAGFLHGDLNAKNIMVFKDSSRNTIKATVIDYDLSIPIPPPGVDCSADNRGMSSLINQAFNSGFLLNLKTEDTTKVLTGNLPNNLLFKDKAKIPFSL